MLFFTNYVSSDMDCLWHAAGFLSTPVEPRPNWNSFMQDVTKEIHHGPILSCSPSLTLTSMMKHAYTPLSTAKNIVISPDFLVWKFCGKARFPQRKLYLSATYSHQEISRNYGIFCSAPFCNRTVREAECHDPINHI